MSGGTDSRAWDDAHCHVAFMADPAAFVRDAAAAGSRVLSVTVTPAEYARLRRWLGEDDVRDAVGVDARVARQATESDAGAPHQVRLACGAGGLRQALGLHPWWVPQEGAALDALLAQFDEQLPSTRFVGEVGLDFSSRRVATRDAQLRAFEHIAHACAQVGGVALSIHCVRAHDDALAILERTGCAAACTCVFHWFSGSSDQLQRAIGLGCWFSVGERMLASKRGRAYARAIPRDRLLMETDEPYVADPLAAPPAEPCAYEDVAASLARAADALAAARGEGPAALVAALRANGNALFG